MEKRSEIGYQGNTYVSCNIDVTGNKVTTSHTNYCQTEVLMSNVFK